MDSLRQVFRPHQFLSDEAYVDLYHVYDNLSQTPYKPGVGIECGDPNHSRYIMNAWHVITPVAIRRHLDWSNREPTQFISFYSNRADAMNEQHRRIIHTHVPEVGDRDVNSVRVARVRIFRGSNVWVFWRNEMLRTMESFGTTVFDIMACSQPNEWFVWGDVPERLIQEIL